jgi:hypothetical protein
MVMWVAVEVNAILEICVWSCEIGYSSHLGGHAVWVW